MPGNKSRTKRRGKNRPVSASGHNMPRQNRNVNTWTIPGLGSGSHQKHPSLTDVVPPFILFGEPSNPAYSQITTKKSVIKANCTKLSLSFEGKVNSLRPRPTLGWWQWRFDCFKVDIEHVDREKNGLTVFLYLKNHKEAQYLVTIYHGKQLHELEKNCEKSLGKHLRVKLEMVKTPAISMALPMPEHSCYNAILDFNKANGIKIPAKTTTKLSYNPVTGEMQARQIEMDEATFRKCANEMYGNKYEGNGKEQALLTALNKETKKEGFVIIAAPEEEEIPIQDNGARSSRDNNCHGTNLESNDPDANDTTADDKKGMKYPHFFNSLAQEEEVRKAARKIAQENLSFFEEMGPSGRMALREQAMNDLKRFPKELREKAKGFFF